MTMDEFIDATIDVWDIPSESATRVGHPAPFPVELPRRLIELYTYRGDLVLDPFMGSGSTALAAIRTERHYVGLRHRRGLCGAGGTADRRGAGPRPPAGLDHRVTVAPGRSASARTAQDAFDLTWPGARRRSRAGPPGARGLGFEHIERNVSLWRPRPRSGLPGAWTPRGGLWLFDLSGGFSVTRPGLRRPDVLWKALGKASVLHEARQQGATQGLAPLIVLSTDVPAAARPGPSRSAPCRVVGPVHDVLELLDPDGMARLGSYGKGDLRRDERRTGRRAA